MLEVTKTNTNNKILTISSRDVAKMMETQHNELLKKIRKFSNDFERHNESIENTNEVKISHVEFWIESTYKDSKGEIRPEFQVTKKGCEYLAMKGTGFKNNIFTVKYMKRFEELENENKMLKETLSQRDKLLLSLFSNNPVEVATAHKQLVEMETKPLLETIEEQKPKAEYHDNVLNTNNGITTTVIAKSYGMSSQQLNNILALEKVQFKRNGQWFLYKKYQNEGYTLDSTYYLENVNATRHTTKWTEKGRKFIDKLLKDNGYV